jgi:hypothetical protein
MPGVPYTYCSECGRKLQAIFFCQECGRPCCGLDCYCRHEAAHAENGEGHRAHPEAHLSAAPLETAA